LPALLAGVPKAAAATLEIAGPAGADITINGRPWGFFPLAEPLDLPPGRYDIRCEMPGHVPYRQEVQLIAREEKQRLVVRLTPFSRRTAWSSNLLLAGMGQFYLGQRLRGWLYAGAEVTGLLTALAGEASRSNAHDEYLLALGRYNDAIDGDEILRLRGVVAAELQDEKDAADVRDLGLLVAGGAVLVSVLDALLTFPDVEAGAGPVPPQAGNWSNTGSTSEQVSFHAGLRLEF
jgi:hypothetical protein